ncbi:MAG TPA: YjbQ family protein, partial [Candidatus Methanomethylophilaceae archaeon]|nr:YjbQ family protein [Candidatus Methanomethylophilaceae archaeon]
EALERIAPSGVRYHHDQKWGDGNGHSHIRASILGGSITIPFVSGKLDLGRWQQLALVENDIRDRHREVIIQIVGE